MRDRFDNAGFLGDYEGPVLLMHGRGDTLIPASHSRRLHRIAHRSELLLVDSNHNDFPVDAPEVWRALERFLREAGVIE
jgi:pimeloyl-ACP methyl ester carboxylesterase